MNILLFLLFDVSCSNTNCEWFIPLSFLFYVSCSISGPCLTICVMFLWKVCLIFICHAYERLSLAMFTQRSLSDLTLDQSKVRSDKVCVNTLNRIGKPDR